MIARFRRMALLTGASTQALRSPEPRPHLVADPYLGALIAVDLPQQLRKAGAL